MLVPVYEASSCESEIDFFFKVYLCILREGAGGRERGRERIPSRLCAIRAEANTGLELINREIMP